jgi:hypothetical protein
LHATDDQAHDIDDGREQQLALILGMGMLFEEGIDGLGIQGVFQQGAHHHTDGAFGHEAFDDFTQNRTRRGSSHAGIASRVSVSAEGRQLKA